MTQKFISFASLRNLASAALAAAILGLGAPAAAQEGVMEAEQFSALLAQAQESGSVRVIIELDVETQIEPGLSDAQVADQRSAIASAQAQIESAFGTDAVNRTYLTMPMVALTLTAEQLRQLQELPGVARVHVDGIDDPHLRSTTRITRARRLWTRGVTGTGSVVAILDTGLAYNNRSFRPHNQVIANSACFSSNTDISTSACWNGVTSDAGGWAAPAVDMSIDGANHGTHVAAIAASHRNPRLRGMAPGAMVMPIQVFSIFDHTDESNPCPFSGPRDCLRSYNSDSLAALEQVYLWRHDYNIAAVNMSLGGGRYYGYCNGDVRATAIGQLRAAGIAVVISSGNSGYTDSLGAPGCVAAAVTVGATDDDDNIASFSNQHYDVIDLMAPGVNVEAAVPPDRDSTDFLSGTSMAAPHVAGAFALLRQEYTTQTVDDLWVALHCTGTVVSRSGTFGTFRRINMRAARAFLSGYAIPESCEEGL